MNIVIGNDHAGVNMKKYILNFFKKKYKIFDIGTNSKKPTDYTKYGFEVANIISKNEADFGILICGTGIGISIAANKIRNVRAALCYELMTAKLSREHNNANILVLGSRIIANEKAVLIIDVFLKQSFNSKKYKNRVEKLNNFF